MNHYPSGSGHFTSMGNNSFDPENLSYRGIYNCESQQPISNQGSVLPTINDTQDAGSHHWREYVSRMKEAQRAKLIEQLNLLPETGITLSPPSESSTRKAAQRPGYIKRPLNAFMIFSKVHRFRFSWLLLLNALKTFNKIFLAWNNLNQNIKLKLKCIQWNYT